MNPGGARRRPGRGRGPRADFALRGPAGPRPRRGRGRGEGHGLGGGGGVPARGLRREREAD